MAIDPTQPQAAVSNPQGNASLDEILSSLEKQVGTSPTPTSAPMQVTSAEPAVADQPKIIEENIESKPQPTIEPVVESPTPTVSENPVEAISALPDMKPVMSETAPQAAPEPMSVTPATSEAPSPASSSFSIEEKPLEATASTMPAPTIVEKHEALKEESSLTPPPPASMSGSTPPPAQEKKSGGFHIPKFAIAGLAVLILLVGSVAAYIALNQPSGTLDTRNKASGCVITYGSGPSANTFSTSNCAGSGTISVFNGPSCPTTQTKVSENPVTDGTFNPSPGNGQCQQIDHNFGGTDGNTGLQIGAGGVCKCNSVPSPTPQPKACGEACRTTSDCRNPSTGGFPVECRNGTCQLPLTGPYACPEGQSQGSICTCSARVQCGQQCGPAAGGKLCNAGSVCGFLTPSNACKVNGVDQSAKQYCIPVNPLGGYSLKRCDVTPAINYIAADSLVKPDGTQANLTSADAVNACKPVCGDKITSPGEECDWGSDNGKPGSMCDATCKVKAVCGDSCSANADCNKHLVTFECSVNGTTEDRYCGLDAVIENGTTIEETSPRFTKPGMWRTSSGSTFSGGSEVYDHENGATISLWTSAQTITLVETKATNRGALKVFIDGKLTTTLDQSSATTQFKQNIPITVQSSSTTQYVCSSNTCRLESNPTSPSCGGDTPTPTPTVPPSTPPFVCLNITKDTPTPKMGDQVRFTCGTVSAATRYEFRYKNAVNNTEGSLDPVSTNSNLSSPLVITLSGKYQVQCRPCNGNSCTEWENW